MEKAGLDPRSAQLHGRCCPVNRRAEGAKQQQMGRDRNRKEEAVLESTSKPWQGAQDKDESDSGALGFETAHKSMPDSLSRRERVEGGLLVL